ncbi:MAG: M23 family metallopeptidase [Angelakisella sp.]
MAQKLILPIDDCQINAGYKSPRYQKEWGFQHYGVDLIEKNKMRTLHACGVDTVVACGMDGQTEGLRLGNCVVIVYRDVQLPDGRVMGLSSRMYHLDKILCKTGDLVNVGTVIGEYGSTGQYSSGPHLHIEFDTDINYPTYAYGISKSGNVIKQGSVDSTMDPCKVFWLGKGQKFYLPDQWVSEGWVVAGSDKLPPAESTDTASQLAKLQAENQALRTLVANIHQMTA